LILNGEIDPHGPDLYTKQLAVALKRAYVYNLRGRGHETLGSCADSIVERFINDPTRAPDTSCLADVQQIAFATHKFTAPLVLLITSPADVETRFLGEWQAEFPYPLALSFLVEVQTDGTIVTGAFRRLPGPPEPLPIFEGHINGNGMTFKVKSPDGQRTIAFVGTLTGDQIVFRREVEEHGAPTRTPGLFWFQWPAKIHGQANNKTTTGELIHSYGKRALRR
jgi:TAP-like protein